ncbi:hypothetical protein PN488_05760 [Nodularia spumigena CS-591/12]|uniref:hypothetical protein n=1 Tax=Nodularia spumigena TaxID=70799 RepID=UPI00232DAC3F|nr:hypothetical protein [Nodularia spumigena]MDB9303882.1 hypothetical protein [Nodularia spumigena CS-591/12]MDB9360620.1 hypothetical protein [Nodularia spumigena CS-588/02]MDB9366373.1 hypothetical protein [Nodularia spumigena CS-588/02A10]
METLTAAAVATLLLTKMIEKVGEKMGEKLPELGSKVLEQIGKLKQVLWRKAPETASAIERVTYQPELVEQQPEEYGIKVLTAKMELATKQDQEVAEVVDALAAEVLPQIPSKVVQVMMVGIKGKNLTAQDLIQEAASGSTNINQQMLKNIELEGDINVGNLTQK